MSETILATEIPLKVMKNAYYFTFNPNLGAGAGNFTPCWFSLSNSETVKAV